MSAKPTHCKCGQPIEDFPYLHDTCHDCYAESWDRGFEVTTEWGEAISRAEEEEEEQGDTGRPDAGG